MVDSDVLACLESDRHGRALRRAWGGRLRTYQPKPSAETRLEAIRKALVRGELALNSLNRWRLLQSSKPAIGWTFTETGRTAQVVQIEIRMARREAGDLRIMVVDETTVEERAKRIERGEERPELLVARRDWVQHPAPDSAFARLLKAAGERGLVVHVIAALGAVSRVDDELHREARQRWRLDQDPLLRPLPSSSGVERRFGKVLATEGYNPISQQPVAQYFLDFAVFGQEGELPVRLDIEVDGRRWHEELPGRYRPEDQRRDEVLKRLGWRPIRLWTDEIKRDSAGCLERIRREAAAAEPLVRGNKATEENS